MVFQLVRMIIVLEVGYQKTINNNTFAFNYFESSTTVDSTSEFKRSYDITTFEFDFKFSKINIFGEVGLGSYES